MTTPYQNQNTVRRRRDNNVWTICSGPAIAPNAAACMINRGFHAVPADAADVRPYNGIRHWRCPACMEEHLRRVAANDPSTETFTPPDIRDLRGNEIFVFGSNTDGRHGKGAAKFAMQKFGAQWGAAEGLTGRCYALPTVGYRLSRMSLEQVKIHVDRFLAYAESRHDLVFLVTQVGCGLAGHTVQTIAPLFARRLPNVVLPREFVNELKK